MYWKCIYLRFSVVWFVNNIHMKSTQIFQNLFILDCFQVCRFGCLWSRMSCYVTHCNTCIQMEWSNNCVNCKMLFTNDHGYVPLMVSNSKSFPHSWLITWFVTIVTRRLSLAEQKLFTISKSLVKGFGIAYHKWNISVVICK
jgi:hypothetical protein